jgi:hypothetical protein
MCSFDLNLELAKVIQMIIQEHFLGKPLHFA